MNGSEEESKENYLEPGNYEYIFEAIADSLDSVFADFESETEIFMTSTINTKMNRVLGVKRIYQLEYVKSVMEVIINANSSLNHNSNTAMKNLINKISNANSFTKITDLFFIYEWNNMYQKAYESLVTFTVNRFTPEPIVKMVFEEIKLPDLFINNIFERNFFFESGRKMFNGNFSLICEMSYMIQSSENLILKKIIEQNEKWKEFNNTFAIPIREKFNNGIQFPKENPFEDSDKPKNIDY